MPLKKLFALCCIIALPACSGNPSRSLGGPIASLRASADRSARGGSVPHHDEIRVVTTFSTLNSFVEGVGGRYVTVYNLVPIGASPETYQPRPQDIAALSRAQVLFENGVGIEVWLQHAIQNASNAQLRTVVLSDGLPRIDSNPHLWMDPVLARDYTAKVRDALIAVDPAHRAVYERNAKSYDGELLALQHWIAQQVATIPASQRNMIVFHNAWQYYNNRFGIRTIGVIELSPGQEPNPAYIGRLVDLARRNHVRAVFSEPEYSPKLAQTLARSAGIRIVSDLYDDSIANNMRVHDYTSMLRYDTRAIVSALR